MASGAKQYGLIMPNKSSSNQGFLQPRPSVFNEESDSSGDGADWVKKALKRESEKSLQKKQTKLEMQRAVQEDPTVYQYDEVYDQMEERKQEAKASKKDAEKKPKYIQSLLLQAERRKRETERRNERLVQKEREAEGDEFKDKEAFVTSAYRQKLEDFNKQDEEERRMDNIEAIMDVSKQKDLSGFYRHLYRQTVTMEGEVTVKQENEAVEPLLPITVQPETIAAAVVVPSKDKEPVGKKERQYRKRRASTGSSGSEGEAKKKKDESEAPNPVEKNIENIDADSDMSDSSSSDSDSSSSSSDSEDERPKKVKPTSDKSTDETFASGSEEGEIKDADAGEQDAKPKEKKKKRKDSEKDSKSNKKEKKESGKEGVTKEANGTEETRKVVLEPPKRSIWEKRTVGPVFDSALERYYQRKATKLAAKG